MLHCYYTCNLVPLDLIVRCGYTPRWLGNYLRDAGSPLRREALSIHPMTCPYVTKLVAAADAIFGQTGSGTEEASDHDGCLVIPGGCDAARRMGDLLAATYPGQVFVLPMARQSGPEVIESLAADLCRLEDWLGARSQGHAPRTGRQTAPVTQGPSEEPPREQAWGSQQEPPTIDYPAPPHPGGVFIVAGPLSDNSLLRLVDRLGTHVSGLESCTSPDRWRQLVAPEDAVADAGDHTALAARLLDIGMCPRRSTSTRLSYLSRRLDETRPSSIIYARQSFCDPGAYDALLVAELAAKRDLPYLEIEVDFPFDAGGPLHTRVEAFVEAQLLDDDLLDDNLLDDDLLDSLDKEV